MQVYRLSLFLLISLFLGNCSLSELVKHYEGVYEGINDTGPCLVEISANNFLSLGVDVKLHDQTIDENGEPEVRGLIYRYTPFAKENIERIPTEEWSETLIYNSGPIHIELDLINTHKGYGDIQALRALKDGFSCHSLVKMDQQVGSEL